MIKVEIKEEVLQKAAQEGLSSFFEVVAQAVESAAGELTAERLAQMSADQVTLVAYKLLREEVLEGGFIQLIHNGYGAFIFVNPFAKAVKAWGLDDFAQLITRAHKLYSKFHKAIEEDMSDDAFMALYEQHPDFDAVDEAFIDNEECFTEQVACYIDDHISNFVVVKAEG